MTTPFALYQRTARPGPNTSDAAFTDWTYRELGRIQAMGLSIAAYAEQFGIAVTEFGNVGGGQDATDAINAAVAVAIAERRGPVVYPIGDYPYTSTIVNEAGVMHVGLVNPAGGVSNFSNMSPTLYHEFNGPGFTWTGANANTYLNSAGGMANLRHVQNAGTAGSTGGYGAAIKVYPTDVNHRSSWLKFWNLTIEEAGLAPWTWAIEADSLGVANGVTDLFISRVDTHVSASTGTCGAFRLNGVLGGDVSHCQLSINGTVNIGDTDQSNSVHLSMVNVSDLILDKSIQTQFNYGIVSNLTTTAASSGRFTIGRLAGTITDLSAGGCLVDWYDGTAWNSNRPVRLQSAAGVWSGSGAPSNAFGTDGDFYFRTGTPATATQRVYNKQAGSWVGLL